jgi:hypothetical protein
MSFTKYANKHRTAHNRLLSLANDQEKTDSAWIQTIETTPIFTSAAGKIVDGDDSLVSYKQFGLLGLELETIDPVSGISTIPPPGKDGRIDGRIFLNSNAPNSAFICGVQGSGKSNSLACMLGII